MTVALCTSACNTAGYSYAGVEYAQECCTFQQSIPLCLRRFFADAISADCGNTISNGGTLASAGLSDCNMACSGNSSEYCGAGNRLDMYELSSAIHLSSTSSILITPTPISSQVKAVSISSTQSSSEPLGSSTIQASATSTASTGTATGLPSGWTYAGCYIDNANGRIITHQQPDSATLTVESCVSTCAALGYTVAGLEYASQCYCDSHISNGGVLTTASDCNQACSGSAAEICGAGNRISVYNTGTLTSDGVATAQTTDLPGSWAYQGCYS